MPIEPMLSEEMPANGRRCRGCSKRPGSRWCSAFRAGIPGASFRGWGSTRSTPDRLGARGKSGPRHGRGVWPADAAARAVSLGQGPRAPGNGLIGTIEAYLSSSPMLLLTDFSDAPRFGLHAPYQQGTGDWGSWDCAPRLERRHQARDAGARSDRRGAGDPSSRSSMRMAGQPGPVAVLYSQ